MTRNRPARIRIGAALTVLLFALAGCAGSGQPGRALNPGHTESGEPWAGEGLDGPPPVTVRAGGVEIEVEPWSYCYGSGCADGVAPAEPPSVGTAHQVEVEFPLEGWTFEADFVPVRETCPRRHRVRVEHTGGETHLLHPAGFADLYDVTLYGRGDGDLAVTFRWRTPSDGPMPVPAARLAILADHDGRVDSYGVELELSNLARTPESAEAEVTVTAANGRALTFTATRASECWSEGTVYWDGPDQSGLDAAELGPSPFTYEVAVVLDGVHHTATAVWPRDQIVGSEPSVPLEFSPPLPALP